MGLSDGFWFQVGRNMADFLMFMAMVLAVAICVVIYAFASAAWEYYFVWKRQRP